MARRRKTGPFCWLAMEYVGGEILEDLIRRAVVAGRLDRRLAFQVAAQLASALEYAHGQGIIHRNLTSRNVLLHKCDKIAKLGDLMLAKAIEGGLAEQPTRPGEILDDPRYMAPERTRGAEHVDARSDLYSPGALVYAVLTGRPPFDGTTVVEKLTKICKEAQVPPRKYQLSVPDAFQGLARSKPTAFGRVTPGSSAGTARSKYALPPGKPVGAGGRARARFRESGAGTVGV